MFKIVNSGDGYVGKTTFLKRYTTGEYIDKSIMTIGTGFFVKDLSYNDYRENVRLTIWDFGGQERFHYFLRDFVYGATAALLFFDLTRPETFFHIGDWIKILRLKEKKTENLPILLVGSKCDLRNQISIDREEIRTAVEDYDLVGYVPTSSKDYINVDESIDILIDYIFKINSDLIETVV